MPNLANLDRLLAPYSNGELAEASGTADRTDFARWRSGARIPKSGPNIRSIAKALHALRQAEGLAGDLAAVIDEVASAARADEKARKAHRATAHAVVHVPRQIPGVLE